MLDNIKANLNEISWFLWIVVIASIFSIFSMIYDTAYINFGFVTFIYGVVGHICFSVFDRIYENKNDVPYFLLLILHFVLIIIWVYSIVKFA
jgi:hypothetical protein